VTTTSTSISPQAVGKLVRRAAGAFIARVQSGYLKDNSSAVALLAQLRRGAGKLPADMPELWGMTGTEGFYRAVEQAFPDNDLPERLAERAETALFLAVTLYALHQQSHDKEPMHKPDVELGRAVRQLMPPGEIDEPLRHRFVRAGTAQSVDVLAYRLREIISLLRRGAQRRNRRESIPLDYALLAEQLYWFGDPDGARRVRQRWGRSFHAYRSEPADETTPADPASDTDDTRETE